MAAVAVSLEEQARFLVAKYGTGLGPAGSVHWSPVTRYVMTPEALGVLLGLILFAIILFVLVRDLLAARAREQIVRDSYERSFDD